MGELDKNLEMARSSPRGKLTRSYAIALSDSNIDLHCSLNSADLEGEGGGGGPEGEECAALYQCCGEEAEAGPGEDHSRLLQQGPEAGAGASMEDDTDSTPEVTAPCHSEHCCDGGQPATAMADRHQCAWQCEGHKVTANGTVTRPAIITPLHSVDSGEGGSTRTSCLLRSQSKDSRRSKDHVVTVSSPPLIIMLYY